VEPLIKLAVFFRSTLYKALPEAEPIRSVAMSMFGTSPFYEPYMTVR
jgi:hypothetical protein